MNKIQFSTLVTLALPLPAIGFEVNTHQALTRCATTTQCQQLGARNLDSFAKNSMLNKINNYSSLPFDGYGTSYFEYINKENLGETAISGYTNQVAGGYKGMIEAGVILEDAVRPHHLHAGDGRFNNHFYAVQFDSKDKCPDLVANIQPYIPSAENYKLMQSNKALCVGWGQRTDNIRWALDNTVTLEEYESDWILRQVF